MTYVRGSLLVFGILALQAPRMAQCVIPAGRFSDAETVAGDLYGHAVALSGDTLVIGAPEQGSLHYGAAYVYERNAGGPDNWGQVKKLVPSVPVANRRFGTSVDIDGDRLVVGAPTVSQPVFTLGEVYLFERNAGGAGNWGETKRIVTPDNPSNGVDGFGRSVSLSGGELAVGAPYGGTLPVSGCSPATSYGVVHLFAVDQGGPGNWGSTHVFSSLNGPRISPEFGWDVALDGDELLAAARGYLCFGEGFGSALIFHRDQGGAGAWGLVKELTESRLGASVDLDNGTAIVGCYHSNLDGGGQFLAHVYSRDQGGPNQWGVRRDVTSTDPTQGFFAEVTIDGDFGAIVSQFGANRTTRELRILHRNAGGASAWGELEIRNISDPRTDSDQYLCWDGKRLALGTDGAFATVLEGDVRLFQPKALASVASRNAGANPSSFTCSAPALGTLWQATVDLSTTGHGLAFLLGYDTSAQFTLPGGQVLLCSDGGSGQLLGLSAAGPLASFSVPVPVDASLCGFSLRAQAVHVGGVRPFALSNAQDMVVGF